MQRDLHNLLILPGLHPTFWEVAHRVAAHVFGEGSQYVWLSPWWRTQRSLLYDCRSVHHVRHQNISRIYLRLLLRMTLFSYLGKLESLARNLEWWQDKWGHEGQVSDDFGPVDIFGQFWTLILFECLWWALVDLAAVLADVRSLHDFAAVTAELNSLAKFVEK